MSPDDILDEVFKSHERRIIKNDFDYENIGDTEKVNQYFNTCMKKIYVERLRLGGIISFEKFLDKRYQDLCYYYSSYAIMGLNQDDILVRGYIDLETHSNYKHGWCEFTFEGKEFVFDSLILGVIPKQLWYDKFNPRIEYKKTQKAILEEFLNEKCAFRIVPGLWQFKLIIINTDKESITLNEMTEYDNANGYIPGTLSLARIMVNEDSLSVERLLAYLTF